MTNFKKKYFCITQFLLRIILYKDIRNKGFLTLGIILSSVNASCATVLNVTLYPGGAWTRDYTLYNGSLTWIEAYYQCKDHGGRLIAQGWSGNYVFLKSAALQYGWPSSIDLWTGMIKYEWNNIWIIGHTCNEIGDAIVNNDVKGDRKCLLLNMATDNERSSNLHAVDCDTQAAYICSYLTQHINDTTDVYDIYQNMTFEDLTEDKTENVTSIGDCIFKLFDYCYDCVGAEFFDSDSACVLYRQSAKKMPIVTSITDSSDDRILIIKKTSLVDIDYSPTRDTRNLTESDYPCPAPETTTTSSPVPTSTEAPCMCKCPVTHENKTEEQIQSQIEAMKKELVVKKRSLSSHVRAKTSAPDDRPSAGTMGYIGGVMLGLVIVFIVIGDVISVSEFLYRLFLRLIRGH